MGRNRGFDYQLGEQTTHHDRLTEQIYVSTRRRVKDSTRKIPRSFHEPAVAPICFGLRQSSGAFTTGRAGEKAAEDCRSPRRSRDSDRLVAVQGPHARAKAKAGCPATPGQPGPVLRSVTTEGGRPVLLPTNRCRHFAPNELKFCRAKPHF